MHPAPTTTGRFVQAIDVADPAGWIVRAGRDHRTGIVDAVGRSIPLAELLAETAAVVGFDGRLVQADDDWRLAHGVRFWAGPRSLPLWLPVSDAGRAQRGNVRYRQAGGVVRPLRDTIGRVLDDEVARGLDRERRSGPTAEDEHAPLAGL